ncbi:MAG TPA: NAD(+) synthase, partial [Porphyromonadaceae bacterium]|nr:NAD(+) synthase [Porphyromonadaceae bacterium]
EWTANNLSGKKAQKTLLDIADTPISPELIPANEDGSISQKTEDFIGPYELHDFFLYHFMRFGAPPEKIVFLAQQAFREKYNDQEIKKWLRTFLRRFFSQQFKRNCLPDGPKVGSISLSPRSDWRMPSDASAHIWLHE